MSIVDAHARFFIVEASPSPHFGLGAGGAVDAAADVAAAAADGDVAAEGEAPSWFSRPRLPRAQRARLARRMMVLTKAIIG